MLYLLIALLSVCSLSTVSMQNIDYFMYLLPDILCYHLLYNIEQPKDIAAFACTNKNHYKLTSLYARKQIAHYTQQQKKLRILTTLEAKIEPFFLYPNSFFQLHTDKIANYHDNKHYRRQHKEEQFPTITFNPSITQCLLLIPSHFYYINAYASNKLLLLHASLIKDSIIKYEVFNRPKRNWTNLNALKLLHFNSDDTFSLYAYNRPKQTIYKESFVKSHSIISAQCLVESESLFKQIPLFHFADFPLLIEKIIKTNARERYNQQHNFSENTYILESKQLHDIEKKFIRQIAHKTIPDIGRIDEHELLQWALFCYKYGNFDQMVLASYQYKMKQKNEYNNYLILPQSIPDITSIYKQSSFDNVLPLKKYLDNHECI